MSTTTLTAFESAYAVGKRHVHFNVRASTPADGAIHEGVGEWCVYREGKPVPIDTCAGPLEFAWLGQDGDEVKGRFVDRSNNAGEWESYTFAVAGTHARVQYVDIADGRDFYDGNSPALAVATVERARANLAATLTTGQAGAIYLKRGQVHFYGDSSAWNGDALAFPHLVQILAYDVGARPILRSGEGNRRRTAVRLGRRGSVHLRGVAIDGVDRTIFVGGVAISAERLGAGARSPMNLIVEDCQIYNCETGITIQDDQVVDETTANDGRNDFVAIVNTTIEDVGNWHMFQGGALRYVLRDNVQFLRQRPIVTSDRNSDRVSNWRHYFVRGQVWDSRGTTGENGGARWQAGQSSSGNVTTWGPGTAIDCTFFGTDQALAAIRIGRSAPDGAGTGIVTDVRFLNCRCNSAKLAIGAEGGNGGNNVIRTQLWNCTVGGVIDIGYLGGGTVSSFEVRDCASSAAGSVPSAHIRLLGAAARYASNSITITGHVGVHPSSAGNRALLDTGRCRASEAAAIISPNSNHNHVGRYGDATMPWFVQGGVFGVLDFYDMTYAQWRTQRGDAGDQNSTARPNSTLGIVNPGTLAANLEDFNPAFATGSGVLDGLGSSRPYSIDAAGFLRSSPSDPGPFEFGATERPELPADEPSGTAYGSGESPVRVINLSPHQFIGWVQVNTDGEVVEPFGSRDGVPFVRGLRTGLDTQSVDLFVDLAPGAQLELADLVSVERDPIEPVNPPVNFFGGDPRVNGVPMVSNGAFVDGQAACEEWTLRVGLFVVKLWTRWYPGEPWVRGEVAVVHSDFTSTLLTTTIPALTLTYGNGLTQILGIPDVNQPLVAPGTVFNDGQARAFPVLFVFPARIRSAADVASLQALGVWGITGHGIRRLYYDANPFQAMDQATWTANNLAGAVERLHTWRESPNGVKGDSRVPGRQQDQAFVMGYAMGDIAATLPTYLEGFRWAARPCHYLEADGSQLNLATHPNLRLNGARPWFGGGGFTDRLGKLEPLEIPVSTPFDWFGPDDQHWWINGLAVSKRLTGSPCQNWLLRMQGVIYLYSKYPDVPTFGSFAIVQSTREICLEGHMVQHCWANLTDRTMADTMRTRVTTRAAGPILAWINAGPYGDIWDVRESTSASIPVAPGWIPWQQTAAVYFLDLLVRQFAPDLNGLAAPIAAGAIRCLNDVWQLEGERWVEYERISISGVKSRSGEFQVAWLPPCIHYLVRTLPDGAAKTKATAIWAQMLGDTLNGVVWDPSDRRPRHWMPPNTFNINPTFPGSGGSQTPSPRRNRNAQLGASL